MKLKDQVVSLELSKKMDELGFKQKSLWYWCKGICKGNKNLPPKIMCPGGLTIHDARPIDVDEYFFEVGYQTICSAYTVAELGEMLPNFIEKKRSTHLFRNLKIYKQKHEILKEMFWFVRYGCIYRNAKTEVNARAKMLIYLKENNLI